MKFFKKYFALNVWRLKLPLVFLALAVLFFTALFSYFAIQKHNAFASGYDLGNMDQTMWNTLYGDFFSYTLGNKNVLRLGTHSDFVLTLISPLYLLWSNVRMLLIFQSFAIATGVIPTYLLAEKILRNKIAGAVIALVYLLNPAIQWTTVYDFHAVALAIPFLLWMFYLGLIRKWKLFFVATLLAISTKENVAITAGFIGLYVGLLTHHKRLGFLGAVCGTTLSFVFMKIIIPTFNAGAYTFSPWYEKFVERIVQNQWIDIPKDILLNYVFIPDVNAYVNILLRPFAYMPLLGFPFLLLSLPDFLINIISDHAQMRSITMHYDSVLIPGIVISTVYGLRFTQLAITKSFSNKRIRKGALYLVLCGMIMVALRFDYHYSPLPITPSCWCIAYVVQEDDVIFEKLLQNIPKSATVTASPEIRPHITHRKLAYTLPLATDSADFIAIIDQNRLPGDYNPKDYELKLKQVLLESNKHKLVKEVGHFSLFQKIN